MRAIGCAGLIVVLTLTLTGCAEHHGQGSSHHGMEASSERGAAEMGALIDKTVKDPQRATRVKALTKEIIEEAKHAYDQQRASHRKLYELNADYDAAPEAFMNIMDEANNREMQAGAKILGLRFQIKEQMTREEWKALTDAMKNYVSRYREKYEDR